MPDQPKTPHRTVRVPDDIWKPAITKAEAEGTTVTAVVVEALKQFIRQPPP